MQAIYRSFPLVESLACRRCFSSIGRMADRDYSSAVEALNSLQSNFAIVDAIRKAGRSMNKQAIPEMVEWFRRVGYEPDDLNRLNVIHISGTKGKGSTSAFISSILCQYLGQSTKSGRPFSKIGLYTSPHLRSVRERIRINHLPLSEELFAKYFFEVWDRLEAFAAANGLSTDSSAKPVYFRYLTLMAFHVYLSESVDTAIIECGIGGEYDSTNIFTKPIVTGITSLGIDHTAMLGNTIKEIAWHKAGIMKRGVPIFTALQPKEAMDVLQERANEKGSPLKVIERHPQLESNSIKLGLAADFQKTNGSLAIAITASHLKSLGFADPNLSNIPPKFRTGLEQVEWGGRCETRCEGNIKWYIDGGHTLESIKLAAEWYATQLSQVKSQQKRLLFFNQQTRDATALARALHCALCEALPNGSQYQAPLFANAIFSTNVTYNGRKGGYKPDLVYKNADTASAEALSVQRSLANTWTEIDQDSQTSVKSTIEDAVEEVRQIARANETIEVAVLVTGSLHLVGGVLEVLETSRS